MDNQTALKNIRYLFGGVKDYGIATRYWKISAYLKKHHLNFLYDALHASGITSWPAAKQWFEDYYVTDQNDGPEKAKKIEHEIDTCDGIGSWFTNPNADFGFDFTPEHLVDVSDESFREAIQFMFKEAKKSNPLLINSTAYAKLRKFAIGYLLNDINVKDSNSVRADWDYTSTILYAASDEKAFNETSNIVSAYMDDENKRAVKLAVKYFGAFAQTRLGELITM